jgi:hypothetical protein
LSVSSIRAGTAATDAVDARTVAAELEKRGCTMQSGIGGTAVVGVLGTEALVAAAMSWPVPQ